MTDRNKIYIKCLIGLALLVAAGMATPYLLESLICEAYKHYKISFASVVTELNQLSKREQAKAKAVPSDVIMGGEKAKEAKNKALKSLNSP